MFSVYCAVYDLASEHCRQDNKK
uniref:Uncharacterized protein n=1 Tax=Arundo donax TaxID=35708 RepID=A0A0A9AUR0_ARUDO